jgi:hypothetical protein
VYNGLTQRIEIFDIVLQPIFKVSPSVFNTVFVRRVRRKPNNRKPIKTCDFLKDRLSMPRGVVHEDDAEQSQLRTEVPLEPYLKPNVFGSPIIYNGRDDFVAALSRYDIQSFFSLARSFHKNAFSTRSPGAFTNDMTLYSALINVNKRSIAR